MKVTAIASLSGHCAIECKHYYPILFVSSANSNHKTHGALGDFIVPPLWKWSPTSSGMLRIVDWYLVTDVSGQPPYASFNPKEIRPTAFPETSLTNQQSTLRNIAQGTAVAQWLRCCATNRKVAGLIPDGVIGIFYCHNTSDCTMALGSTQSLTEMSIRNISWG